MIKSLAFILFFQLLGEGAVLLFELPVPGPVVGMVFLTLALSRKWLKVEDVGLGADLLVKNMAFLFVPPGVGLMVYFDLIKSELAVLAAAYLLSTFAVLATVGLVQQALEKR